MENVAEAVVERDWKKVRRLVEQGKSVNDVGQYSKRTALHVAAQWGDRPMSEFLLAHGANINQRDEFGHQPLHTAALYYSSDSLLHKLLVDHKADVTAVDDDGNTPLLLTGVDSYNDTPEVCRPLITNDTVNVADQHGNTILHLEATYGHRETVQLLVDCGADVNVVNKDGQTPLHTAAGGWKGCPELCSILLEHHAKIDVVDKDGNQPLHLACKGCHTNTCCFLLSSGSNVNAVNQYGQTPLHIAADGYKALNEFGEWEDDPALCSILLEYHAKIDVVDKDGNQPLHLACNRGRIATANFLLTCGADATALNEQQRRLLCLKCESILKAEQRVVPAVCQTATARALATAKMKTTSPLRQPPRKLVQKAYDKLVVQLTEEIKGLTRELVVRGRKYAEVQQRYADLEKTLQNEQLQRERAVTKERKEKEELQQRLQQERDDKLNIQKDLNESQKQIAHICEETEDLERLLNEEQTEKANIAELLSDAEAVIERNKQREDNEVLRIPSQDIRLTETELGGGSYGVVRIGYWRGCRVAVKITHNILASPLNIQLLQQEVSVAWKIHHPNIAAVCGVTLELEDDRNKKAWIVMELHSGSMSGVINACRGDVEALTLREMIDMTHDSLCGLDYIHSLKPTEILHGDICPRNILVTVAMTAKLGDLGAARFHDASLSVGLLSPQYTAPERFAVPAQPKSKHTDMYSMGVTICELFTAIPPNCQKRMDQVVLIRHRSVRSLCKHLLRDDPATRSTASDALDIISGIRETRDYRACPPKRMVKGKMDGIEEVTLVQSI